MAGFRVWVNIPNSSVRSGYLARDARPHHPATAQTVAWPTSAALFPSQEAAEGAIGERGWEYDTSVRAGKVTAYAVSAQ